MADWKKKLQLDMVVAVAMCVVGFCMFLMAGEGRESAFILYAPLMTAMDIWTGGAGLEHMGWGAGWVWVVVLVLLLLAFVAQFVGKRGRWWTVAGAVAVAVWWFIGLRIVLAALGTASC